MMLNCVMIVVGMIMQVSGWVDVVESVYQCQFSLNFILSFLHEHHIDFIICLEISYGYVWCCG